MKFRDKIKSQIHKIALELKYYESEDLNIRHNMCITTTVFHVPGLRDKIGRYHWKSRDSGI